MEFRDVIRKRYSCKKYSDRIVEAGKLERILEGRRKERLGYRGCVNSGNTYDTRSS